MTDEKENIKLLYQRFFRGEKEAIVELVTEYRMGLIAFINGYVKDVMIAEDLAGDVFAELLVKKPKLKKETAFKTYLFSMARNAAISYLRKNKRLLALSGEEKTSELDDPEWLATRNEKRRMVLHAMKALKREYGDVLFLRYYEELPIEAVGKIMKKNKRQVYNLLARAKTALKEILEKEGIYYEDD